jgi:formylglycine-generating enzyme required for sulfatase activity
MSNTEELPFRKFSLSDFKKWMDDQPVENEQFQEDITGSEVQCRVGLKRLISKMETEDGEANEVAKDFKKNGGTATSVDGDMALVEVESGSLFVPLNYITK